ncbi:hypothetical protein SCOR_32795 [Sulfidibacter corallicola]
MNHSGTILIIATQSGRIRPQPKRGQVRFPAIRIHGALDAHTR